jgi:hypothetical protein
VYARRLRRFWTRRGSGAWSEAAAAGSDRAAVERYALAARCSFAFGTKDVFVFCGRSGRRSSDSSRVDDEIGMFSSVVDDRDGVDACGAGVRGTGVGRATSRSTSDDDRGRGRWIHVEIHARFLMLGFSRSLFLVSLLSPHLLARSHSPRARSSPHVVRTRRSRPPHDGSTRNQRRNVSASLSRVLAMSRSDSSEGGVTETASNDASVPHHARSNAGSRRRGGIATRSSGRSRTASSLAPSRACPRRSGRVRSVMIRARQSTERG